MRTLLFLLFAPLSLTFLPKDCGIAPEIKKETNGGAASLIGGGGRSSIPRILGLSESTSSQTRLRDTGYQATRHHLGTLSFCGLPSTNVTVCHGTTEVFKSCADSGRGHAVRRAFHLANYSVNDCQESRDFAILELKAEIWPGVPICLCQRMADSSIRTTGTMPSYLWPASGITTTEIVKNTKLRVAKAGKRRHCGPGDGHLICTSWRTEESAICEGDSGGPLMELVEGRHVQVGINHMSNGGWCNVDSVVYSGNKDDAYQGAIEVAGILPVIQSHVNLK